MRLSLALVCLWAAPVVASPPGATPPTPTPPTPPVSAADPPLAPPDAGPAGPASPPPPTDAGPPGAPGLTPPDALGREPTIDGVVPPALTPPTTANGLSPISVASLPERCRDVGTRAVAANRVQALPARIALAGCLVEVGIEPLDLIDASASVLEVSEAIAPAIALLDEVIASGDPAIQVMALHRKALLYAGMTGRMLTTIPPPSSPTREAVALQDSRRRLLEAMLSPWRDEMVRAYQAIVELAIRTPALAANPVARTAIRDSRQRLEQHDRAVRAALRDAALRDDATPP